MGIYKKVRAVEKVFDDLNKEIIGFQAETGLKCLSACGMCCTKPDIEASVLEFLPFAYHLYKEDQAITYLERLKDNDTPVCILFNPFVGKAEKGFCSKYKYRGLICRLFGFSGRKDKYGNKNLVTCKIIKTEQVEEFDHAAAHVAAGTVALPMMSSYAMRLYAIDFQLAAKYYPINMAIRIAIETVLSYYSYRSDRTG